MKIYIRRLDGDKEIINKFRIPMGLFLNTFTARIAASAVSRDFKKDILKGLESLKNSPEVQGAYESTGSIKFLESTESAEATELAKSAEATLTSKEYILNEANDILPLHELEKPFSTDNNENKITPSSKLKTSKYTIKFADGTSVERENNESRKKVKPKISYQGFEVSKSNNDITRYINKNNKSFSLFASSDSELEPYIDKLNALINSDNKDFNNALAKNRKKYKKQKRIEFNKIFKVLKKSARQNKGLRLLEVQSKDDTIVVIEF